MPASKCCKCVQSVTLYFDKNKKTKHNWTKAEKYDIYFWMSLVHYRQKLNFGGETEHKRAFQLNFFFLS